MLENFIDKLLAIFVKPPKKRAIDWRSVVNQIQAQVESHSIYLELGGGGWSMPDSLGANVPVTGVAVVYVADGVKAWDTKPPAEYMAKKLSSLLGRPLPIF